MLRIPPLRSLGNLLPILLLAFCPIVVSAQSPSDLLPDLEYFKLTFPLDEDGNDYTGIAWEDRDDPHI
ncbi:MAG: hypothetical protein AAF388_28765, partial [Bacteroidota bacterium]